jgi:hypothetical protein
MYVRILGWTACRHGKFEDGCFAMILHGLYLDLDGLYLELVFLSMRSRN